jgi:hypothetical protein
MAVITGTSANFGGEVGALRGAEVVPLTTLYMGSLYGLIRRGSVFAQRNCAIFKFHVTPVWAALSRSLGGTALR